MCVCLPLQVAAVPAPAGTRHSGWARLSAAAHPRRASLVIQRVKRLPAMQDTWIRSPGWEDPLEKEMATHSSAFAWKMPWMEEPGRL